ncbi:MAG: CBS domain-containing protein [Rhodobacterales bacterium]|nr:CBS domain-containing protein [Rhodobacterales bacterium]
MLVQQILRSKADDKVMTVSPDMTIGDAAAMLSEKRIGSLVVSSDGVHAEGILSERDIVREVGRRGSVCLTDQLSQIMTRALVTCTSSETADGVLQKMTDGRFRHLPVVEEGRMIGLISIGDVVKARLSELEVEKSALEGMIMGY